MSRILTRRGFITGGAATAAGFAATALVDRASASPGQPSQPDPPPALFAIVAGVGETSLDLEEVKTVGQSATTATLGLVEGGRAWRGGGVQLSDFRPGDHIVAAGSWDASRFAASDISIELQSVFATVSSIQGQTLDTDAGAILYTDGTKPIAESPYNAKGPSQVRVGDAIFALVMAEEGGSRTAYQLGGK